MSISRSLLLLVFDKKYEIRSSLVQPGARLEAVRGGTGYLYDLFRKLGLSDFGARTAEFLLVRPMKVALIVAVALVAGRLGARWVRRWVRALPDKAVRPVSDRAHQRAATLAEVLASLVRTVVWSAAVLLVFDQLGINLAPLLAGAGVVGLAVGFGAQTLVRDVISGLFILVEDQYGVGDAVSLGDTAGTVEEVNLRVTRLRADDGTVWYVPNGEVRRVGNTSMEWGRALVDVVVPGADVETASRAIAEEARQFAEDPDWRDVVLEGPELLGAEALGPDGVTLRVVVRTAPRQQQRAARALRARINTRLRPGRAPA